MDKKNLTLTMLGTGHATVTKCYNTCFLLHENEEYFMVDAGGGNRILGILEEQGIEGLQTICGIVLMKKVTKLFGEKIRFVVLQDGDKHRYVIKKCSLISMYDSRIEQVKI